jgi:hypothetical protein
MFRIFLNETNKFSHASGFVGSGFIYLWFLFEFARAVPKVH